MLFYHFFSVALLGIWLVLSQPPWYKFPLAMVESVAVFYKACVVLFPFIISELRT